MKATCGNQQVTALIDPGSVSSYINKRTAANCKKHGWKSKIDQRVTILADGTETKLKDSFIGQIRVMEKTIRQQFLVMENLNHDMLLGMDALRKLNIKIQLNGQTLRNPDQTTSTCTVTDQDGPSHLTTSEIKQLEHFLENEMKKFNKIKGATSLIQYQIQLENSVPIKQRYRPRNPAMQQINNRQGNRKNAQGRSD